MVRAVDGSAASRAAVGNGRYNRTWTTPTRSPRSTSAATVCFTVSAPEPITTRTRSPSGCPL